MAAYGAPLTLCSAQVLQCCSCIAPAHRSSESATEDAASVVSVTRCACEDDPRRLEEPGRETEAAILYSSVHGAVPLSKQRAGTDRRTDPNGDEWSSSRLFVLGDVWLGPWAMLPWPWSMDGWIWMTGCQGLFSSSGRPLPWQPLLGTATLQLLLGLGFSCRCPSGHFCRPGLVSSSAPCV